MKNIPLDLRSHAGASSYRGCNYRIGITLSDSWSEFGIGGGTGSSSELQGRVKRIDLRFVVAMGHFR